MENLGNDFTTTLSSAIADGVTTSINVVTGTGSPAANFRIRIDDELMSVTSKGAGTDWTVTRGIEGSAAVAHANGMLVAHVITKTGLDLYVTELTELVSHTRMFISGLTYANNGVDATNDIDIAVGKARDSTDAKDILLASALMKQSDVAWAVGTNAGMLDTGVVGNSGYYLWLIKRSDTGVVDVLSSLSSTAPAMPANYDFRRLIGWFKRVGGMIVAFDTYETEGGGLEFIWDSPTLDISLANTLTTSRRTDAVKVPLNFSVVAKLLVSISDASTTQQVIVYCPDQADLVPSSILANYQSLSTVINPRQMEVRTSATGTIAARTTITASDTYDVHTVGFRWARRN